MLRGERDWKRAEAVLDGMRGAYRWGFAANVGVVMGWTATATVGKDGLGPKMLKSVVIEGARGRFSMGRVVANGGDEGCDGLAGAGDMLNPLDFAILETLAFTRTAGLVEAFSGERRGEGEDGGVG